MREPDFAKMECANITIRAKGAFQVNESDATRKKMPQTFGLGREMRTFDEGKEVR